MYVTFHLFMLFFKIIIPMIICSIDLKTRSANNGIPKYVTIEFLNKYCWPSESLVRVIIVSNAK